MPNAQSKETAASAKQFVDTTFGKMAYAEAGEGFPTIFIHGLGQSAYFWRYQSEVLVLQSGSGHSGANLTQRGAVQLERGAAAAVTVVHDAYPGGAWMILPKCQPLSIVVGPRLGKPHGRVTCIDGRGQQRSCYKVGQTKAIAH